MTRRSQAGASAAGAGAAFERDLLNGYRPPHVHLEKHASPWRMVGTGASMRPMTTDKGVPDFFGSVDRMAWVFDAKAVSFDHLDYNLIPKDEVRHLDGWLGRAEVGVLVRFDRVQEVYWLPWAVLSPMWHRWAAVARARPGEASVARRWCAEQGRRVVALRWWE